MQDFLASLAGDAVWYIGLFAGFTLLAFLSRGRDALRWTPGLRRSALTNLLMLYLGGLGGVLYLVTITPLVTLYHALHLPVLPASAWAGVPFVVKGAVAFLVYDTSLYWVHRMLHKTWLWPAHAVHHSDPELHFLSWSRGHFTEQFIIAAALVFTSTWLGFKIEQIYALATLKALHQYYVHSKIDWDHGPLKYVIASPQIHRWHHANVEAAYDKNFASIFPFLDLIWGTYYNPGSAVDVPTGISGENENTFMGQFLYPFREWSRMLQARREARAAGRLQTERLDEANVHVA